MSVVLPSAMLGRALTLISGLTSISFRLHKEQPLKWWTGPEGWSGFLFFLGGSLESWRNQVVLPARMQNYREKVAVMGTRQKEDRGSKKQTIERTGSHPRAGDKVQRTK